ncbi:putative pyrophosphatase [Sphaerochaeta pleomorpha str. Grapes]|uniref:Putative pyrophosphatase n=1 Tax=Sphaerochaeta pleomorpha (strain ATCC BAA-1885 / DSM 22778 / Grapes) TaxID=158190 RepID=G8QUC2_SPHPG|nr:MazG-like family protein [Sphaerochaeta pleomorpha]AEV28092.1 putative pyrophosphatase [Sphaerochaeta pleomorpha str. Grapes]
MESIQQRIKNVREENHLSLAAFAKSLELPESVYSQIEMGLLIPSYSLMMTISSIYAVSVQWLYDGINKELPDGNTGLSPALIGKILKFRDDRDWKQFHNPKDLAISISLEAAELLECFQWSSSDTQVVEKKQAMREELADVLIYCVMMADALHADITSLVLEKLHKNGTKYKVEQAYGNSKKYSELEQ